MTAKARCTHLTLQCRTIRHQFYPYSLVLNPITDVVIVEADVDGSTAIAVFAVVQSGVWNGITAPPMLAAAGIVHRTAPAVPSRMSTVTLVAELLDTVIVVAQNRIPDP